MIVVAEQSPVIIFQNALAGKTRVPHRIPRRVKLESARVAKIHPALRVCVVRRGVAMPRVWMPRESVFVRHMGQEPRGVKN